MPQIPDLETGARAASAFIGNPSVLAPLQIMYERMGHFFRIPLPGFRPFVVAGPEANRRVLVTERQKVRWRNNDPVTDLLRRGVLVTDGEEHDLYRGLMEPALSPATLPGYTEMMLRQTDRISSGWQDGATVDMLVEARKIALLIVMEALFGVDFWPDAPLVDAHP